ncbi:MAG: hypothetical protein EAZ85_10415 [Bacteroidetes bacterium]|nr:MAG: hypothetical protein EAZ85_10415 [Bacteroidota bacterium]
MYCVLACHLKAQNLPNAEQIKQNPSQYNVDEINLIQNWINQNPKVKFFQKNQYDSLPIDDKFYLEAFGHLIVYTGNMLSLAEINAYETKKNGIISRTYADYKTYLFENDRPKFFEWFGY